MAKTGMDKNPVSYISKSAGKGSNSSQIMKGAGGSGLLFSPPKEGDRAVGTKRYDVTNRSLNRGRGM